MLVYALDIGGSSIKHALVTVSAVGAELTTRLPTIDLAGRSFTELREHVVSSVSAHALDGRRELGVAISTTGAVDRDGLVLGSGFFDDYVDVDWAKLLQAALPIRTAPIVTVNDGKATTWAEYQRFGRGCEVFVNFVVGTGVGGGIVCFDHLLYGDDETAGALGHMKVGGSSDVVCSCGRQGCVETLASGPAVARSFQQMLEGGLLQANIATFDETYLAARNGDRRALHAFKQAGEWLGVAISNVINVMNPRYITVGGGVMEASMGLDASEGGPYLRAAIRRASELAFEDIAAETIIRSASTGNDGGLLGAALLCAAAASDSFRK